MCIRDRGINAVARGHKLLFQLGAPGGVGKVARAQQTDPLASCIQVEMGRIAVPAGGAGKAGMNVEVGNIHEDTFSVRRIEI